MALTSKPKRAGLAKSNGLTSAIMYSGEEKASSTYKQGAFLIDDDAGRMTESTSPIDASAVAKRTLGMALADASGTTDAQVLFVPVGEAEVFSATLSDSTAGTHTLAQADKWAVYPITKDPTHSTGFWYLDANAVSDTGGGLIVGFQGAIGDVDAVVYFIVTTPARGTTDAGGANI